jgi:hypothetical protein
MIEDERLKRLDEAIGRLLDTLVVLLICRPTARSVMRGPLE